MVYTSPVKKSKIVFMKRAGVSNTDIAKKTRCPQEHSWPNLQKIQPKWSLKQVNLAFSAKMVFVLQSEHWLQLLCNMNFISISFSHD